MQIIRVKTWMDSTRRQRSLWQQGCQVLQGRCWLILFRTAFRNLVRDMKYQLERSGQKRGINAVSAAIRPGIISDKLNNAIATGKLGTWKGWSYTIT